MQQGKGIDEVLRVEDLRKDLQLGEVAVHALRGVSLTVTRGEFMGIIGPSGSGKSTLLGLIGGLDTPTAGKVYIDGTDITNMSERALTRIRNEKIGFVFQFFNLIPTLTALENVALPLQFSAKRTSNAHQHAKELLTMLGLGDRLDHRPTQLSGGQQQRVAIARALANHPPLILCDEPTGSLDSEASDAVMSALRDVQAKTNTTVIIVTHDTNVASQLDRLVTLVDGQIASDSDPHASAQQVAIRVLRDKRATGELPSTGSPLMVENIRFYVKHSLNDLRVNGQRTFFALLCIAAGVAAIVSLQTLAVMIQSSLVGSLQESNRGDIQLQADSVFMGKADQVNQAVTDGLLDKQTQSIFGQQQDSFVIGQGGIQALQTWLDQHYPGQAQVTYRQPLADPISIFLGAGNGTTLVAPASGAEASQVVPVLIDPQVYPFYGTITAQDGQPLAKLITSPTDVVLSAPVAQLLQAKIGDTVKISGSDANFTLRGIVETAQEVKNPASDTLLSLFGFYYLDKSAITQFAEILPQADVVFIRLTDPSKVTEINRALKQQFPFAATTTTEDLRQSYTQLSDTINKLVTIMGLLSLLIGSIGIINTMQVIVRRRTVEVAVLKTLGLQGNQITLLFLIEAVLLGIFGSLIGIVLGWGATFLIRGVAERVLSTTLPFVLSPSAAVTGFVVGVIVTTVFGFLPTLTAGQVRPGVVLRPSDAVIPKVGRVQTLLSLGLIILVLSLIAQTILGSFTSALAVVVGAFLAAGLLYLLLNLVIWVIGRFVPAFGVIDLKLSLRQMAAGRGRASMTLLALVVGVFSLSTITLLTDSVNNLLSFSLAQASGGNVTISVALAPQLPNITQVLDQTPGVQHYQVQHTYSMNLVALQEGDTTLTLDDLRTRLAAAHDELNTFGASDEEQADPLKFMQAALGNIGAADLAALPEHNFSAGRQLTSADSGKPVLVIGENRFLTAAGIGVGDKLTFAVKSGEGQPAPGGDAATVTLEVVGVTAQSGFGSVDVQNYAPADAFPANMQPTLTSIVAQVDKEQVTALRQQLSSIPGVFVIDNAALTRLITNLIGTFTAFPTMVALLGLIVGGVVIANSVALTTMERRREIAVMKSVGLQRERVLFMILLENGILGLIGGLIGVGIGLIALVVLIGTTGAPGSAIPVGTALLLMLLCIVVSLVAALSTAWGASGERPLNVLRYE